MARTVDPLTLAGVVFYAYERAIPNGAMLPNSEVLQDTAQAVATAEQSGDDVALGLARITHGVALVHRDGPVREDGMELLALARDMALREQYTMTEIPLIDSYTAQERAKRGDLDGAIELSRTVAGQLLDSGGAIWTAFATAVFVEALLRRRSGDDLEEAKLAIDRFAAVPTDPGSVLHEIWRLRMRALLARACGDEAGYKELAHSYLTMATELGFEGHMKWAEAMP